MGLDVGVVTIKYLERPGQPVYAFLCHMAGDINLGLYDSEYENDADYPGYPYTWGGGWEGNTLVDYSQPYLSWKAAQWADRQGISSQEKEELERWIAGLLWNDADMVTLFVTV